MKQTLKTAALIFGRVVVGALIALALRVFMWAAYSAGIPM